MPDERVRMLNGYRVIYLPEHPRSMKSENWLGYVYEHIVVAESSIGRPLTKNEVVHHLNENRSDNRSENLLVLERSQHTKLHNWLNASAVRKETSYKKGLNSGDSKAEEPRTCKVCCATLQGKRTTFCSNRCAAIDRRKCEMPPRDELKVLIEARSYLSIGKMFGVTGNAVRKWAKKYDLL